MSSRAIHAGLGTAQCQKGRYTFAQEWLSVGAHTLAVTHAPTAHPSACLFSLDVPSHARTHARTPTTKRTETKSASGWCGQHANHTQQFKRGSCDRDARTHPLGRAAWPPCQGQPARFSANKRVKTHDLTPRRVANIYWSLLATFFGGNSEGCL